MKLHSIFALGLAGVSLQAADPRIDNWFTRQSGSYARIYTDAAAKSAGKASTTWSNGTQNQTLPAYSGIQEI